jgi:hypothetical protein
MRLIPDLITNVPIITVTSGLASKIHVLVDAGSSQISEPHTSLLVCEPYPRQTNIRVVSVSVTDAEVVEAAPPLITIEPVGGVLSTIEKYPLLLSVTDVVVLVMLIV